jgi:hypothetical protein
MSGLVSDHVYPVPEPVMDVLESDNRYSRTTFSTDTPYGPVAPGEPSFTFIIEVDDMVCILILHHPLQKTNRYLSV